MSTKLRTQLNRFGRVFLLTLVPLLFAMKGEYTEQAVVAAAVAAAEVGWRAAFPATPDDKS